MWKERYRVGVDLIDDQHQELFRRLTNFIKIIQNNIAWEEKMEEVDETLKFLSEYVVYHFDDEERYQEEIGYPGIDNHKEAHRVFKEGINDYVKLFEEGEFTEEKIKEFSAKLMTWLILHVGKVDQELGQYVKSKGGTN